MSPSLQPSHELIKACLPTRADKQRIGRTLGLGESAIYKWCEDPEGSGRPNPLDHLEVVMDHARLHYPLAAFAIVNRLLAGNARAVGGRAISLGATDLLLEVQPTAEKEITEALLELTAALRSGLRGEVPDLQALLKEVDEAERELERTRIMISAAIEEAEAR